MGGPRGRGKASPWISPGCADTAPGVRILFITATRIGDAVLSTGLLDHLLRTYPDARFTIACGPVAEGVFERMPRRERTIVVDKRRYDAHWLTLWLQTVTTRWDLAVDLRGSALTLLLPARRRTIMRGGRRPGHRLLHIAGTLKLAPPPLPVTWTNAADDARAAALIPSAGPVIGLGPTANWSGKVWPADRFIALFHELAATMPGARPAIFAGPGPAERTMAAAVLAALPGAIDLVGCLSLPEAAACLARCTLFIGNDSGLMHLAAAAGAPTLGLFGPTPASEYAPAGRRTAVAQAPGPPGQSPIDTLTVAAVVQAAQALLDA
jgi:heptosyltransferase-3